VEGHAPDLIIEFSWLLPQSGRLFYMVEAFENFRINEESVDGKRLEVCSRCLKKHFTKVDGLLLIRVRFTFFIKGLLFLLVFLILLSLFLRLFFRDCLCCWFRCRSRRSLDWSWLLRICDCA
jgi:hypothetical protein